MQNKNNSLTVILVLVVIVLVVILIGKNNNSKIKPVNQTAQVANPQCSDGLDNDGDALIDSSDPTCHTDGVAVNSASYNPNWNNEGCSPASNITVQAVCQDLSGVKKDSLFVNWTAGANKVNAIGISNGTVTDGSVTGHGMLL